MGKGFTSPSNVGIIILMSNSMSKKNFDWLVLYRYLDVANFASGPHGESN